MKKDFLLFYFVICIGNANGQSILLFTSNWSGIITDVSPVLSLVFNNYFCTNTYSIQYITPGLNFLSSAANMAIEGNRLRSINIVYKIGEPNSFLSFIYPSSINMITNVYPTDQQLLKIVIAAVNAMYDPFQPKSNIMVVLSRNTDINNVNVNNYENIINVINQQNWLNVKFLDYQSADDVITQLRLNPFYNIITLLSDPSSNRDLIQKAYMANLMVWKYRWLIVNLLGEYNLLQDSIFGSGVLSNNVSIITFADPASGSTGRASLLGDALKTIRTLDCDQLKPASYTGISGSFSITPTARLNFKYMIFKNPGKNATQFSYISHDLLTDKITFPSAFNFVPFVMNISSSLLNLKSTVFRIGFVNYPPFAIKKDTVYSGFLIDLLLDVLKSNNLSYVFIDMTDTVSGSLNTSNLMFSNLLGMVQNGIVDTLTLGYIISVDRLTYFDFATNFLSSNISVLTKDRTLTGIDALQNYEIPLDWNVWVTFLGSAFGIAFALAISDYLFPDKFARYKLLMSLFFSFSSLTHGAYFDPPRKLGGRIIMSFWWIFCLLVAIIWACNYAAFQAESIFKQQLTTFFSLLDSKIYRFGTLNNNLVFNFLSKNNDTSLQSMLQLMREDMVNGTVPDFNSAVQLVMKDNYSFIYENKVVMYLKNLHCLEMFGNWMSFEYGMVLPKNSEKTIFLSNEFTKRRGNGMIDNLNSKYWPTKNTSCTSTSFLDVMITALVTIVPNYFDGSFDIEFMIGVFVIVIGGGVCCLLLSMIERFIRYILQKRTAHKNKYQYDNTVMELTQF